MNYLRLKELRLNDFGKFHNKTISLKEGFNLLYGENEAGKSTVHSFIKGMLFGIEKLRGRASRGDTYERFAPWDYPGSYWGSMDLETGGKDLRIIRNFDKNNKKCTVIDLKTGREQNLNAEELIHLYGELTEAGYRNTISIEQLKIRTDRELAEEVRNYITNLSLSKSNEVDVTKALMFLQNRRKELEDRQLSTKLSVLEKELEEGLKQEAYLDRLALQMKETKEKEKELQKKRDIYENTGFSGDFPSLFAYRTYLEQFPVIKEKYRNYKEVKQQRDLFEEKQSSLQKRLQDYRDDFAGLLRQKMEELGALKDDITAKEEEKAAFGEEEERVLGENKKRRVICSFIPAISGIAGIFIFMGNPVLTGLFSLGLLAGIVMFFLFTRRIQKRNHNRELKSKEYEKAIALQKDKVGAVLIQFQAEDEKTLKKKYEEALRQEMAYEHLQKQKRDYREQTELLSKRLAALEQELINYLNRLDLKTNTAGSTFLDDGRMEESEDFITRQLQAILRNQESLTKESENLRLQKEKLKWELVSLENNEEKLLENQELYKELLEQKNENDLELEAIKLSIETINSLSVDIHDSFGRKLNDLVSDLTIELTNHKYRDIKIDEKLNMKVGYRDNYVQFNQLSAGTIEQLYFALRMSVSDLVYAQGVMPVLLDDSFALYDDKRTKAALLYLSKSRQGQVLLFTCHNREKSILDDLNINYNYIDLSKEGKMNSFNGTHLI